MNKIIFSAIAAFSALTVSAQKTSWSFDASHAKVGFSISHFGISETEGRFTKFAGTVLSDRPDFSDAKINFTIDAASINTDDAKRDEHLRSADFFDAAKYPSVIFTGRSLMPVGKNRYVLAGNLQMHGVTREVKLEVLYKGTVIDPYKNTKAGFKVSGILDRTQYGLTWNGVLAAGGVLVGNEVTLDINVELIKK